MCPVINLFQKDFLASTTLAGLWTVHTHPEKDLFSHMVSLVHSEVKTLRTYQYEARNKLYSPLKELQYSCHLQGKPLDRLPQSLFSLD